MADQIKLRSNDDYSKLILFIIASLFFIGLGLYFLYVSFDAPFPHLPSIIPGVGAIILGLMASKEIYYFNTVLISENYFEIKTLLCKTLPLIYFNEIASWYEIEYESKRTKYFDLYICTGNNKYRLNSDDFPKYEEVKSALIQNIKRDTEMEAFIYNKKELRFSYRLFAVSALLLLIVLPYNLMKEDVTKHELYTIEGIIAHKGKINGGAKTTKSIEMTLKSYPYVIFEILGSAYSVMKREDYCENVFKDDTLYLEISKKDYQVILADTMKSTFRNSSANYYDIHVYGLRDKHRVYLTYQDYEKEAKSDGDLGNWIAGVLGLVLFIFGMSSYAVARQ
jgi:hypothetical protein